MPWATLLLLACVHIERPPASWGNVISNRLPIDCNSFEATYENRGNKPDGTVVLLALWLQKQGRWSTMVDHEIQQSAIDAHAVSIKLSARFLTIQLDSVGAFRRWDFDSSKGEFSCQNGSVRILRGGDLSGDNVAAVGSKATDIYEAEGYLVLNSHSSSVGTALLIPMAEVGSAWGRFQISDSITTGPNQNPTPAK